MNDSNTKMLRGQLRQIAKEILPEVMTTELKSETYKSLAATIDMRLKALETSVRETLERVDGRSKEVMAYLIRMAAKEAPVSLTPATETKVEKLENGEQKTESPNT